MFWGDFYVDLILLLLILKLILSDFFKIYVIIVLDDFPLSKFLNSYKLFESCDLKLLHY